MAGYVDVVSQLTRDIDPMVHECWPIVCGTGPTLGQIG